MKLRQNVFTALFAAALCVLAPLAVPVGFVPMTLATLGVYLLLGAVGAPVFAGFAGGVQQLAGLTGGYLWGYLLCALTVGLLLQCSHRPVLVPVWLAVGTAVLYAAGTGWYWWQTGGAPGAAVAACVLPFLPADVLKIAVATALILPLRERVRRLVTMDT